MKPLFITFTGADDRTESSELASLAKDYPVEFALLYSESRRGTPRYPTGNSTTRLVRDNPSVHFAVHMCGQYARQIASGDDPWVGLVGENVRRVQVNLAEDHRPQMQRVRRYGFRHRVEMILQSRADDEFPCDANVQWLFDRSGGRGEVQERWPTPAPGMSLVGYAGGLGPDTPAETWADIAAAAGGTRYWVDMETKVRNDRDEFDIGLCRKVCEAVYG